MNDQTKPDWKSRTVISLYVGFAAQAATQFWGTQWQIVRDNQEAVTLAIVGVMALAGHLFRRKATKTLAVRRPPSDARNRPGTIKG